jgi:hypothetical protein
VEILPFIIQTLVLVAGSSVIATIVTAIVNKRRTESETVKNDSESRLAIVTAEVSLSAEARALLNEVRIEAKEAKLQSQRCETKIKALEGHIDKLETLMLANGLTPPVFEWTETPA